MFKYKCLKSQINILGEYSISPLQIEHIEEIRNWRNQQMDVLRQTSKISVHDQRTYFSQKVWSQLENSEPTSILLGLSFSGELIGYGGLVNIEWIHKRAELSFLSATNRAGDNRLYSADFLAFLTLIKNLVSEQLNLKRLFSETYHFRKYHIGLLESSGFLKEGVLRQHSILDGKPIDSIIHGHLFT